MDELSEHLDALARDGCYRVDAVMKESAFETTQLVYFVGANGSEQGPYVRKYLDGDAGLGAAYERLWRAQRSGRRFLHLPLVLDCHAVGSRRVVVMEFVRGETLADVVYRCDPSVALACDVFPKLCGAVRELHEAFDPPLIHRDLKPSNVMLTRDNLTLIDFGIARSFDEAAEQDTHHFGTRAYAPPEQFGYGQSDARTDVYALGMLLYFCLTERTPDAKARRAGYRDEGIPEPFRAVVERAASFDPRDRYASVRELEEAFGEAARRVLPPGGSRAAGMAPGRSAVAAGEAKGAAAAQAQAASAGPAAGRQTAVVPEPAGAAPLASSKALPIRPAPLPAVSRAAAHGGGAFWGRVPRWAGRGAGPALRALPLRGHRPGVLAAAGRHGLWRSPRRAGCGLLRHRRSHVPARLLPGERPPAARSPRACVGSRPAQDAGRRLPCPSRDRIRRRGRGHGLPAAHLGRSLAASPVNAPATGR